MAPSRAPPRACEGWGGRGPSSVEGVAAGAGAARVGVVDREALLLDGVDEVDRRATEVGDAHPVDDDLGATKLEGLVAVEEALVEEQLVAETGAATGLHGDPQPQVVATLLLQQRLRVGGGGVAEDDAGGAGGLRVLPGHVVVLPHSRVSCSARCGDGLHGGRNTDGQHRRGGAASHCTAPELRTGAREPLLGRTPTAA